MTTIAKGSGFTTRAIMKRLQDANASQFSAQLTAMGVGAGRLKKSEVQSAVQAFKAGARAMLMHLENMGVVVVMADDVTARDK